MWLAAVTRDHTPTKNHIVANMWRADKSPSAGSSWEGMNWEPLLRQELVSIQLDVALDLLLGYVQIQHCGVLCLPL